MEMKKGLDSYSLKKTMVNVGYDESEVNEAVDNIIRRKKIVKIVAVVVLLIIACGMLAYSFMKLVHFEKKDVQFSFSPDEAGLAESAISKNDAALCEYTGQLRDYCIGIVKSEVDSCKNLPTNISESCIMRIAGKNDDVGLCNNLKPFRKNCYLYFAIKKKDKALCDKTENFIEYCRSSIKQ